MVRNDFKWDIKELFHKSGKSVQEVADSLGNSPMTIYQYGYSASITKRYVEVVERLGYDIEVEYVPLEGEPVGLDLKGAAEELFKREGRTKVSMSEEMGVAQQQIAKYLNHGTLNKRYVDLVHALGYEVKAKFIKRD